MTALELIAERRIAEALSRGELDNLPGSGQPLALDDDAMVPAELRMACRILKNAGFIPPELEPLREIGELERLVDALGEGPERRLASKKLRLLRLRLDQAGLPRGGLAASGYLDKVLQRLG